MLATELHTILLSSLLAVVTACSGSSKSTVKSPKPPIAATDPSCPVAVPGTSVTVEDAANGAALVFVTTGDVSELRRRASAMSKMHNDHHGAMGPLPDGTNQDAGHAGHDMSAHAGHDTTKGAHAGHAGGMVGVHSKATASDVEGGAMVLFVVGAADVAKLQSELRNHAQHLGTGTCTMGSS
jgi:hypothetical protein